MASVITIAGEQLFAAKAQANEQLDIDTFIFANVPNQDPNAPINREEGIPTAHIVYDQKVQQVGRINDNVVVYSTVLDSKTGPFEFNWVGLYSSVNQKLVAINHVPTVSKTKTVEGAAGNTLNRNFGIEYSGIAELTGITVEPETWQLDFTARLSGMDLLTQQLAADMNGKDWFIDDGLKVVPRTTANTFSVTQGVGYVSGLRVELKQEHILIVQSYPQFVYVDAWFSGNANSTWSPQLAFTVTNTEMDDYLDPSGAQHYVYKLAVINTADSVADLRSNVLTKNFPYLNEDFDGFTASLLYEAGIDDDDQPDSAVHSKRVEALKKIHGVYSTVTSLAAGRHPIGTYVILTDRANKLFKVIAKGENVANGRWTLNAGFGRVAILDDIVSYKAMGAKGNWDATSQTGDDDTLAMQAAFDYIASLDTSLTEGERYIEADVGSFRYSTIEIPASIVYGLDIKGHGELSSTMWADHTNTEPAFIGNIEMVHFQDMQLVGGLAITELQHPNQKEIGLFGKLATNKADIDAKFTNCRIICWKNFADIHGRGCVFNDCSIGLTETIMRINADPDTVFSGTAVDSVETGMRHYTFNGGRLDVVKNAVKVVGTGPQKDYINAIQFNGVDKSQVDNLIVAEDAIIRRMSVNGGGAVASFFGGAITAKSVKNSVINAVNWNKSYDDAAEPEVASDCIEYIVKTSQDIAGLTISDSTFRALRGNAVETGTTSTNVKIIDNYFPEAWTFADQDNHFVYFSAEDCPNLEIRGNSFSSSTVAGTYRLFNATAQVAYVSNDNNVAPWAWTESFNKYIPTLKINGVPTAGTVDSFAEYSIDNSSNVNVQFTVVANISEGTGVVSISLPPISAIPHNTLLSNYSGGGSVDKVLGFSVSGAGGMTVNVNPVTQEAEMWTVKDLAMTKLNASYKTGTIVLGGCFNYSA